MATNKVQEGDVLVLTVTDAVSSGDVVIAGGLIGVAKSDIAAGESGPVDMTGVWNLPKASEALTQGDPVYWDATSGNITTTDSGNTPAGHAVAAAAAGDATCRVKLPG